MENKNLGGSDRDSTPRYIYYSISIIPCLYFAWGLYCLLYLGSGLTIDGYFQLTSGRILKQTGIYTGIAAVSWPPLYTLLMSGFGFIVELELAGKLISLLSATGLLLVLPFFSRVLDKGYLSAIVLQFLVAINPDFLRISLWVDNHLLDAFLFTLAGYFGVRYFRNRRKNFPWYFLCFALLAFLTRYGSGVLLAVFWLLVFFTGERDTVRYRHGYGVLGLFLIGTIPWFLYNYLVNDVFVKGLKALLLVGQGLSENGLMNISGYEWWAYKVYDYENVLGLIQEMPSTYLAHVILNLKKLVGFTSYSFPVLGLFSFLILVGLGSVLWKRTRAEYRFLLAVVVVYVVPLLFLRIVAIYILHLSLILAWLGLAVIVEKVGRNPMKGSGLRERRNLIVTGVVIAFLLGGGYKVEADFRELQGLMDINFKHHWTHSFNLEENLERLKSNHKGNHDKIKIMGMFTFFPIIYEEGFRTVQAPPAKTSPKELFCYKNLSERQNYYYTKLNYPPNKQRKEYVPADYLLLTPHLISSLKRSVQFDERKLKAFIKPLKYWNHKSLKLFRIRKTKLNCSGSL